MEIQTAVAAAEDRAERYRRRAKIAEQHACDWHLVADSQSREITTLAKQVSAVAPEDTLIRSRCCLVTWQLLPPSNSGTPPAGADRGAGAADMLNASREALPRHTICERCLAAKRLKLLPCPFSAQPGC